MHYQSTRIIKFPLLFVILLAIYSLFTGCEQKQSQNSFSNNQYIYNIRRFGARKGGQIKNTRAIQQAIDECSKTGGIVLIPPGDYLTGSLNMKSNVTLHIAEGATLLGSTEINDYAEHKPVIPSFIDSFLRHCLIYGKNLKNVAITGKGTIDGQGSAFKVTTRKKPERYFDRPYLIRMEKCKNVTVENVTLQNSAMWMQHYFVCEDVKIRGIRVYNHCNENNDMIDIDGCRNVIISDCIGDTDDDALTIKSTAQHISENITITNCILSSHVNAIKCGTESHGGFKNITISNIVIKPSIDREPIFGQPDGIAGINLACVDGGILDGITISNIRIVGVSVPIFLRLGDRARKYKEDMPEPDIGKYKNVNISNITATKVGRYGCSITGMPEQPVENITLNNISITYSGGGSLEQAEKKVPELREEYPQSVMFGELPAYGFYVRNAKNVDLNNIDIAFQKEDNRYAFVLDNVTNCNITDSGADIGSEANAVVKLINSRKVFLEGNSTRNRVSVFCRIEGQDSDKIGIIGNDLSNFEDVYNSGTKVPLGVVKQKANIQ